MLYTFQLAWRRILRSKAKTLLSSIQLSIALTLFVTVLTIYLGIENSIHTYKRAFGSDLYIVNVFSKTTSERDRMPFQFSRELIGQLRNADSLTIYEGTIEANIEGKLIISLSEELHRSVVTNEEINHDLLSRLGFHYLSQDIVVAPILTSHSIPVTKVWIKGNLDPESKLKILKILGQYGDDIHFNIENVLGLSEEKLNTAKGLSLVFLVFTISIIVCFAIGHLGIVLLDYLRNKRNWAIHILLGASRKHIIVSYMFQFIIIALPILLFSIIISSIVIYYYDSSYLNQLPWSFLATSLLLSCIMILSILPITNLKNDHLISQLS